MNRLIRRAFLKTPPASGDPVCGSGRHAGRNLPEVSRFGPLLSVFFQALEKQRAPFHPLELAVT